MSAPAIEVIQGPHSEPHAVPRRSARGRVFVFTLLPCLLIGLAVVFLRPPVYETAATLLTVKPKGVDQRSIEADLEHVTIQQRLLLADEVLEQVAIALRAEGFTAGLSAGALRSWLSVHMVSDTNLVELRAEGEDPELLQSAVNHWADAYVNLRAARVNEASGRTTAELAEEQVHLQLKLEDKRAELASFRERYNILSMEREENQVLARLKGMQASLNKAQERLVDARAQRSAIEGAIAKAQPVVPDYEKANLNALQAQAQAIRDRLAALKKQYTPAYLDRDPELKALPGQLQSLEATIRQILSVGRGQVLADADQELAAAQEAVADLEASLTAHKQQVADFTRHFSEHKALEQELLALEELANENQERLARIEIANRQKYPPLEIVDRAPLPLDPVRPLYWRDAGIAVGLSVLLALFMAWLVDYLAGRTHLGGQGFTGIRIYGAETPALPGNGGGHAALPTQQAPPQLAPAQHRALELGEVQGLLQAASAQTAAQVALLMSGVAPDELAQVTVDTVDAAAPQVLAGDGRSVSLGAAAQRWLAANVTAAGADLSAEQVRAGLAVASVDAGLAEPTSVTPEALRHTYLLYLVRQGLRLGELPAAVGPLSSEQLAAYAPYAPPGPKRTLAEIERVYPAFLGS